MPTFIFAVLLAILMLLALSLNKTYQHVAGKEVRRQARRGDQLAKLLYKPVSYGVSLPTFLWLIIILTAAGSFVLFATIVSGWVAFILIVIIMAIGFWWLPTAEVSNFSGKLATWLAPLISKILYYLHPVLSRVGGVLRRHYPVHAHTGLYEKEDLLELMEWQKQQHDNRILPGELDMAGHALVFGDKMVRDIVVPRRVVTMVATTDPIGPLLMDELHKGGHSRFPVYEGKKDNIVGTLYLRDLLNLKNQGDVSKIMRRNVYYVHEDYSLYQVLQAFLKTKHHLFIVVNNFEEFVGIVTIEDVLEQIIGQPIQDEFDHYDDMRAVASSLAEKEHKQHTKADAEPAELPLEPNEPTTEP